MKYRKYLAFFCFLTGALYCTGLTFSDGIWQNVVTIIFICLLILLFIFNFKEEATEPGPGIIILQTLGFNLGIGVTAYLIETPTDFFWVSDSITTHLPASLAFKSFFESGDYVMKDFLSLAGNRGGLTHLVTGLSMTILGINTLASICGQLFFKVLTVFAIFRISVLLWDKKTGFIATQLYAFCPTVFFYNLTLYKESSVQMLVAFAFMHALEVALRKKYLHLLPLLLLFWLLKVERFYVAYLMMPMFVLLFARTLPFEKRLKYKILFGFSLSSLILITLNFDWIRGWCDYFYRLILQQRRAHASFSDVMNRYNYEIPYAVAFVKILFSPYFSFNKFKLFSGTSLLLIWGSFINQLIIFTSIGGLMKAIRVWSIHIILWLPLLGFLLLAAYVSPWSGRLRDSYYPLIACYGAYFLRSSERLKKLLTPLQ